MTAAPGPDHPAPELPRPLVGVGVIAQRPDGRIAVGHRITAGETPCWCLPGGHVEGGETPAAAGLRELAEESGVRAVDASVLGVGVRTDASGVVFVVRGTVAADAELSLTEPHAFDEWRWVDPDALPEPVMPHTRAALQLWRRPGHPLPGWDLHPTR